jgi:vacuole morphology and inheritance protein 14
MAELLLLEENLRFSTLMVDTLSTILLTSTELFDLRSVCGWVLCLVG